MKETPLKRAEIIPLLARFSGVSFIALPFTRGAVVERSRSNSELSN
jgi:hypothetical protein